ncbi:MAG: hypothetical protein AB8F95_05850 [Bacteroidia bacterium]
MKIKLLLLIGIGIIGFFVFRTFAQTVKDSYCLTTQISSRIFDFNTFELVLGEGLDINDFTIINKNSGNIIFQHGKHQKGIHNNYGHRIFEVHYKEEKLIEAGHFVKNDWITNDYILNAEIKKGRVIADLKITGKNASYNDYFVKQY